MAAPHPSFTLTRERLLADLRVAYAEAARHKKASPAVVAFARGLEDNLARLADALISRTYAPGLSSCFIIRDPKHREVFAADFADRVVHHLYYDYTHTLFERTFIADSYSCIVGRGTHYGISRLAAHIRSESLNYQQPAYVLKLDVRGYFMHIRRQTLADIATALLDKMATRRVTPGLSLSWADTLDFDFLRHLTRAIAMADATAGCVRRGSPRDWDGLPRGKSLFHSPPGCGLPIGNLTSQLFSNVYLGRLDEHMKRDMGCRHYGRYVDDAFVVSRDRQWLQSLVPEVRRWLSESLGLELHEGKTRIVDARRGVEFLGAYIKPGRAYVANQTLSRMERHLADLHERLLSGDVSDEELRSSLSSFGGVLGHCASFRVRQRLFSSLPELWLHGEFDESLLRFTPSSIE